jgi:hypothetical protein
MLKISPWPEVRLRRSFPVLRMMRVIPIEADPVTQPRTTIRFECGGSLLAKTNVGYTSPTPKVVRIASPSAALQAAGQPSKRPYRAATTAVSIVKPTVSEAKQIQLVSSTNDQASEDSHARRPAIPPAARAGELDEELLRQAFFAGGRGI